MQARKKIEGLQSKLAELKQGCSGERWIHQDDIAEIEADILLLQEYLDGKIVPGNTDEQFLRVVLQDIERQENELSAKKNVLNDQLKRFDRLQTLLQ